MPFETYTNPEIGISFKYPANRGSSLLVSKKESFVHLILPDEHKKDVLMKMTIDYAKELYPDLYDQRFTDNMVDQIIFKEAPMDLTEEQFVGIKECVSTEVVTLSQAHGSFQAWQMKVYSDLDKTQLASFAMIIPVQNQRSYRVTVYPIEDEVTIKEQEAAVAAAAQQTTATAVDGTEQQSADAAAAAATATEEAENSLSAAEKRKQRKEQKKRTQAEERLFREVRNIIDSLTILPMDQQVAPYEVQWTANAAQMRLVLPSLSFVLLDEDVEQQHYYVAAQQGNSSSRKYQVRISVLPCDSEPQFRDMVAAKRQQLSAKELKAPAVAGALNATVFQYDTQFKQGEQIQLTEQHVECWLQRKQSKKAIRLEILDGLQLLTAKQFTDTAMRIISSIKFVPSAEGDVDSYIIYKNFDHGMELELHRSMAEVQESEDQGQVNVTYDFPDTQGRIETSVRFFSVPQEIKDYMKKTGRDLTGQDLMGLLRQNLAQRMSDATSMTIVEQHTGKTPYGAPTCSMLLRKVTQLYLPDMVTALNALVIVNCWCTSVLVKDQVGDWRICHALSARVEHMKADAPDTIKEWIPGWTKKLHESLRFFESKKKVEYSLVVLPLPARREQPAESAATSAAAGQSVEQTASQAKAEDKADVKKAE